MKRLEEAFVLKMAFQCEDSAREVRSLIDRCLDAVSRIDTIFRNINPIVKNILLGFRA
jgi:hypothetical protein